MIINKHDSLISCSMINVADYVAAAAAVAGKEPRQHAEMCFRCRSRFNFTFASKENDSMSK